MFAGYIVVACSVLLGLMMLCGSAIILKGARESWIHGALFGGMTFFVFGILVLGCGAAEVYVIDTEVRATVIAKYGPQSKTPLVLNSVKSSNADE